MKFGLALVVAAALTLPAVAQDADCTVFRQDVDLAAGWMQVLPVAEADAAVADFSEFPFLDLTMNGETVRYTTTSGGTGIRSRTAYTKGDVESLWYAFYDVSDHVAPNQPAQFLIIQGDLYWPDCPA